MEPIIPLVVVWIIWVLAVGAFVGSWLNLCVDRLPLEKGVIWPSSRCENCFTPIRWYDNIPIFGYIRLRGKCRTCGAKIGLRSLVVECFTAICFFGLFYLEILRNIHDIPLFTLRANEMWKWGVIPWQAWAMWIQHATLVSFLIIAAFCDLARREIPLVLTITGTLAGLLFSTMFPWPWPTSVDRLAPILADSPWYLERAMGKLPIGVMPWPMWGPLPSWAPPGTWQGGLFNGLAGAMMGMLLLRAVRFVFTRGFGREALGLGDADLMMMAGAFVGWQVVLVAFFLGAFFALFLAIPMLLFKGDNSLPFGPALGLGVVVTWLMWSVIGRSVQLVFFDWLQMTLAMGILLIGLFVAAVLLRLRHGVDEPPAPTA
ncbi:prepilin peptidase [Tuwongella immobilis]|uniref:Peptidase A24A N-terminal domain-containing protein n=1 Tax=Tuwongella immobilis TaxID=692036 RepID=A0A6C2YUG9_9BACT|nr:A24 family peptidase [Tuwongella immobilis]VIP05084.1 peptidase a24 : Prepilin signal peptidase PulO-like peptidase OS=Singulisphaera acidiphila (strain ATCC BAA-1392 / DSM 18658 / VKM B-2454 / MOB10) GN=Sinac_2635 PE=4 SV=1: DiS_P_DiS: Peptidase_A24 [Tuwongella immobilis]VTS07524.1 peptidase a24 : Prepilin signal peptidase PulO-like peptidase OS=Singulisphaera acidiphila (strain ATCC BAA-1392 / DSM 18658 / VKM B-2454 / MOB10) GN=Sinac_2635 PE=4 SV=1: DiS_P_DiS: Peptidase_A24 [Tuwongella immob